MGIIYSNVPPLKIGNDQYNISDYLHEKIKDADELIIATGYASKKSIIELDRIIREEKLPHVVLILGMYCIEGFPEGIYNAAIQTNANWIEDGIGEIRVTKSMKYHGKAYGFIKNGSLFAGVVGSHNMGSLVTDANNIRQYELSMFTENEKDCVALAAHLEALCNAPVSFNIADVKGLTIIHEENTKLTDVEGVTKVSMSDVETYKRAQTAISFDIPLKVPGMPGSSDDFMKSNVNKCYAKGRLNTRTGVVTERGWWETEIIVGTSITNQPTYPEKDVPFYVITDDGWKFKAHASGDHKKNFESDGDLKILGYWLKGRLVAAGVVEPVDSPSEDLKNKLDYGTDIFRKCKGVITFKKLSDYGRTSVKLTKTLNKLADEDGIMREVWVLSFLPESVQ